MTRALAAGLLILLAATTACSGGADPSSVDGVPASWVDKTAQGWPDSDGYGDAIPTLVNGADCLLGDRPPEVLGGRGEFGAAGWGPLGDDLKAADSFRYLCELGGEGYAGQVQLLCELGGEGYAGQVQLLRVRDAATGEQLTRDFAAQTSTSVQDNRVTSVTSGRLAVQVLQRWIPSNPQGSYIAQYYDAERGSIVSLEINSLDRQDYEAFTDQDAADALVAFMAG